MTRILRRTLACALLVAIGGCEASPAQRMERTVVSKMSMADLESSASGYVYNHGSPVSFVHYTDHGSQGYYEAPIAVHEAPTAGPVAQVLPQAGVATLGYQPGVVAYLDAQRKFAPYVEYQTAHKQPAPQEIPLYVAPEAKLEALAPYYPQGKIDSAYKGHEGNVEEDDDEDEDEEDDDDDESDDESYEAADGEEHEEEEHHVSGEKGDSGYKNRHGFNKGEQEEYDDEHQEGHYDEESGLKKSHVDAANEYGEREELEKGKKGDSFGHASYHKKGEKTNGYHNVYRKDEYKKDTDFYDEDHKAGHFDKYSSFDENHKAAEGGFEKTGHHVAAHDERQSGRQGHYDKGRRVASDQGHKYEKGQDSYYDNHGDYDRQNDAHVSKKHGYHSEHH